MTDAAKQRSFDENPMSLPPAPFSGYRERGRADCLNSTDLLVIKIS